MLKGLVGMARHWEGHQRQHSLVPGSRIGDLWPTGVEIDRPILPATIPGVRRKVHIGIGSLGEVGVPAHLTRAASCLPPDGGLLEAVQGSRVEHFPLVWMDEPTSVHLLDLLFGVALAEPVLGSGSGEKTVQPIACLNRTPLYLVEADRPTAVLHWLNGDVHAEPP